MNEYLVSIVIPVYNVERYIDECMKSIQGLDSHNVEIILVNDGSTDESGKICKEYANTFTNVKCVEQKNQGLSEARNTVNRSPSSRQLKKYKFSCQQKFICWQFLCSLQVNFVFFHWC